MNNSVNGNRASKNVAFSPLFYSLLPLLKDPLSVQAARHMDSFTEKDRSVCQFEI